MKHCKKLTLLLIAALLLAAALMTGCTGRTPTRLRIPKRRAYTSGWSVTMPTPSI